MKTKKIVVCSLLLFAGIVNNAVAQATYGAPATAGTGGSRNVNIGSSAGATSVGYDNTFVGSITGASNSAGAGNSIFGGFAFRNNTSGSFNVGLGYGSLNNNTIGNYNVAIGKNSMPLNTSGSENIAIGQNALDSNNTGNVNVAIGRWPLKFNTTGVFNVALGGSAGYSNVSGSHNIFIGESAGSAFVSGESNTFLGPYSGRSLTIGFSNIFIGNNTGVNLTDGSNNTFLGTFTLPAAAATPTSAGNNTSNTIIIADGINNQRLYIHSNGNTGIGLGNNVIPQNRLEVKSGSANTSGLRFTNLPNTVAAVANPTTKVLSVDASGDVILVNDLQGTGGTISNALTSSANTMTSVVNGSSSNAPIVNSISNTITNGQLTTTVNGVASTPVTLPSGGVDTDAQTLSITGSNQLTISNGNTVTLPSLTEVDGDVTNELQTISQASTSNGTEITLSHSGGTVVVDGSETKIQAGTNVTVTGAGTIASPYVINSNATGVNCNIYTCDGTLSGNRVVTMDGKNLIFNTSGNTTTTGGRIYIGNTTAFTSANFPTTTGDYRLNVEGGILTEKVKVALRSSANWADYVFADNYKLMPLNEVEAFVKENKHLPGVVSAENLAKEGLDLGQMQAKQMEKIEELTLYVIEQNKTIEKQSKEIEELKAMVNALVNKTK